MKAPKDGNESAENFPELKSLDPDDVRNYDEQVAALRSLERILRDELERRKVEKRMK